jgi:hypothetical protein
LACVWLAHRRKCPCADDVRSSAPLEFQLLRHSKVTAASRTPIVGNPGPELGQRPTGSKEFWLLHADSMKPIRDTSAARRYMNNSEANTSDPLRLSTYVRHERHCETFFPSLAWGTKVGNQLQPADSIGDTVPPFAELPPGLEPVSTIEELARIRYQHSKTTARDMEFVMCVSRIPASNAQWDPH